MPLSRGRSFLVFTRPSNRVDRAYQPIVRALHLQQRRIFPSSFLHLLFLPMGISLFAILSLEQQASVREGNAQLGLVSDSRSNA